ncbi:fatty-acyl-CoA synthase [Halopolyspora algeriensis]|uniref:Fatty-acyl-CoA synthase n=1 Tax=Halopolyspora algeriensis TaxID=1500506 RepID=A0A368VX77_9ACTN|nr:long-chain fatty acid--CoA ligase [Halopolyspora algeriensis]RCW45960.1 fatty-acyl-CoA synthase [Halopolyspora algeriensis]TQM55373.1 fatty-acyl-CoA synthase [Halopolyspora algeriensis]
MRNEGVGSWPYRRLRLNPDKTAITFRGENRSYAQLDDRVTRLAHALRDLGVGKGDRVALLSRNHPSYLEALFASGLLGAIFVPLNARLTAPEVAFSLQDAGVSVFLHSAELTEVGIAAAEQAGTPQRVVVDGTPDTDAVGYEEIIAGADTARIDEPVSHDDPCFIMYTSGTTGRPKGVVLTHGNIVFSAMNAIVDLDLLSDEVSLVCAPLFHTAALDFVALPTLLKGGTVCVEEGFDAERVLSVVEREGITYMFGAPTMCDSLSSHPNWEATDLSSIRRMIVAAAPVPPRTLRTYADRGIKLCQAYGLTETGPGALILTPGNVEHKLGTAGVPHFFTDVRLADSEGEPVDPGQRGEIQICGPNVMRDYWNRPDATADASADEGWFRSGDVGVADADGFVTVVDRMKDMIISGGENIYPAEVEAALMDLPGVASCAVFGVPDEKWGEVGRAAVTLESGTHLSEQDMVDFLTERLAKYKIPKTFLVLDEIPRNASGKIRKHELREHYAG